MSVNQGVFLDRDGVLNKSYGRRPPSRPEEFHLIPGVAEAVRDLHVAGYKVFVVTNQGGVGLGYMKVEQLEAIHAKLTQKIGEVGGVFEEIMACTHRPKDGCECRKPRPGMILELAQRHAIDLTRSYIVGDRDVDVQAGQAAGVQTIFIGQPDQAPDGVTWVAPDLGHAAGWILSQGQA